MLKIDYHNQCTKQSIIFLVQNPRVRWLQSCSKCQNWSVCRETSLIRLVVVIVEWHTHTKKTIILLSFDPP